MKPTIYSLKTSREDLDLPAGVYLTLGEKIFIKELVLFKGYKSIYQSQSSYAGVFGLDELNLVR